MGKPRQYVPPPKEYRRRESSPGRLADALATLRSLRDDGADVAEGIAGTLHEAMRVETSFALGLQDVQPGHLGLRFIGVAGDPSGTREAAVQRVYANVPASRMTFKLAHVPQEERMRVLDIAEILEGKEERTPVHEFMEATRLTDRHMMRVLVCDGPRLLGNVGVWDEAAFDRHDRAVLQACAASLRALLRRRLLLDDAGWMRAGMEAAMAALPAPAMLVDRRGRILHCNPLAQRSWADGPPRLDFLRTIQSAPPPPDFDVTPVQSPGLPPIYLVLQRRVAGSSSADQLTRFCRDHRLTRRESEVLGHLMEGHSNRAIAEYLACALRTVELHVSKILRKADLRRRTEVVAAVWRH